MIRAGAKNHEFVTVVTDPNDYPEFISQIDNNGKINTHTENILPQRHLN